MIILLAVIFGALIVIGQAFLASKGGRGTAGSLRPGSLVVAAMGLAPLLVALLALLFAGGRFEGLRLTYLGKQLTFGSDAPILAGASGNGADLPGRSLVSDALILRPADGKTAADLGIDEGDPVLFLASPSPVVKVDGTTHNSYPMTPGDRIALTPPRDSELEPVEIVFSNGSLDLDGQSHALPGSLELLFRSTARLVYLPTVLKELTGHPSNASPFRSFLYRPAPGGPWELVIRDAGVEILRGGERVAGFVERLPVERDIDLHLQVVRGSSLSTVRRDHLAIGDQEVDIRFANPRRVVLPLAGLRGELEIGLAVPSTLDRPGELLLLDESSARFRGFQETLLFDTRAETLALGAAGSRQPVELDKLYALGHGTDRLLVRFVHTQRPWHLLADVFLFGLFVFVFFGKRAQRSWALTAVLLTAGTLLTLRLLFAYRAATSPPSFDSELFASARLAFWVVAAAMLAGGTAGRILRKAAGGTWKGTLKRFRWALVGLAVASLAVWFAATGHGASLRALAFFPLAAILVLAVLAFLAHRPGFETRLSTWQSDGWAWAPWMTLAMAALVLIVRLVAASLGMPETLRLPVLGFRLLWSAVQLPICALVVALSLHLAAEKRSAFWKTGAAREARPWLITLVVLLLFLVLAFAAVALSTDDNGLLIVHALPLAVALLLLFRPLPWPKAFRKAGRGLRVAAVLGLLLTVLPAFGVMAVNLFPDRVIRLADTIQAMREGRPAEDAGSRVDPAGQLRSNTAQRIFRLQMLADPQLLRDVGNKPAERVALHYHMIQSYATRAGFWGTGFASTPIPRNLGQTHLNDLVPLIFVLAEFGLLGLLALALIYLLPVVTVAWWSSRPRKADRLSRQGQWLALIALLAVALPSLYMILANLNLVLFTGKNCSLLSLNSLSDVLQAAALLGLATFGLGMGKENAWTPKG